MASIQSKNNRLYVVYYVKSPSGARKQIWEPVKNKSEATKRVKELDYKIAKGMFVPVKCKTVKELIAEYVNLYGKQKWSLSTYSKNMSLIDNYIIPTIGQKKLEDINTHFLEFYYQELLETNAVNIQWTGHPKREKIGTATISKIHKLLHNCFEQAIKWELMEKNPADRATVPKHEPQKREIWTNEQFFQVIELCNNDVLEIALHLAYSCTLRCGEILGLTWDCVDISEESIRNGSAHVFVNKEVMRVNKAFLEELKEKDVMLVFPNVNSTCKTVHIMKTPKTKSSIRKVYLPRTVADKLREWKEKQEEWMSVLGDEYQNYNLVLATGTGLPFETGYFTRHLHKLCQKNNIQDVVFHSLRHLSITNKLKISGGDMKAVQGDSGHSQASMVMDVYSHIVDSDRKKNAELFQNQIYNRFQKGSSEAEEEISKDDLLKLLEDPKVMEFLKAMAKTIK